MIKGEWKYVEYGGLRFYQEHNYDHGSYLASVMLNVNNKNWFIILYQNPSSMKTMLKSYLSDYVQDLENPTIEEITLLELETGLPMEDMFDKLKKILQEGVSNDQR